MSALYLRKVVHPQAHDNYRVILKDDGVETEIGSINELPHADSTKPRLCCVQREPEYDQTDL